MALKDLRPAKRLFVEHRDTAQILQMIEKDLMKLDEGRVLEVDAPLNIEGLENFSQYCHAQGFPMEVVFGSDSCRMFIQKGRKTYQTKLKLENVGKAFITENGDVGALEKISFEVGEGEFVCIVGPSGCGKSTLLYILAGLENADEGIILLDGQQISASGPDRVLIFQEPALFPWLNVIQNVAFGLKVKGISPKERLDKAKEYLQMVHLAKFQNSYVHELSGGMKQRVAIARALALEPDVLLMDEPFSALDGETRRILHLELQEIWQKTKKTIVFVTHNLHEAICLADRVMLFTARPGRLKKQYHVDLARPRDDEDLQVVMITRQIKEELREEIEKVMLEQL